MATKTALALAGLALTGGAVLGTTATAQAAAPATAPATAPSGNHTGSGWYGWSGDEDEVVAVFHSYRQCAWAARVGERRGYFDDADCDFVRTGYRGHWRTQWGTPFHRSWQGNNWHYRGIWVLRADVD